MIRFTVEAAGRVDVIVGDKSSLSRAKVKALFEDGAVKVNGRRVKKGVSVAAGDTIEVEIPSAVASGELGAVADSSVVLKVLHEDASLVFVEKPAGLNSQPLAPGEKGTVANGLIARFPEMAAVADDPREAGLCHRLDKETSGVILAARTREAWQAMRAAFSEGGQVEKHYLALVNGPLADEGEIDVPLAHAGDHVVPSETEGRPAFSIFKVLKRHGVWSLVDVQLVTGVLHQVRAHLAAIGAPIAGDVLYGGKALPGLERFFLHASSLDVTHPVSQKRVHVECQLPPELSSALAKAGFPT
ncbi:MAG: RluA family pseudouridine synthase [Archangium sp.]|nr:RluA family pseudouridine synthase [Archangium sp.]